MKNRNSISSIPGINTNISAKDKPNDEDALKSNEDDFTVYEDLTSSDPKDIYLDENISEIDLIKEEDTETDLDIPGSELDDDQEEVGSEDEENNYYSIGGDNHNDLEEENDV